LKLDGGLAGASVPFGDYVSNRGILMTTESRLSELKNIGSIVEQHLNEIGVFTRDDLERIGPSAAYRRLKDSYPDKTLPRCYYLYSLEGALRGVHWNTLPDAVKRKLSKDAGFKDK
jgi:DNA transformation protein